MISCALMFCYLALQVGLVYGSWSLVVTGAVWVTISFAVVCDPATLFWSKSFLIEYSDSFVTSILIEPSDSSVTSFLIDPVASAYVFMAAASYLWVYSHILETNAVHQR